MSDDLVARTWEVASCHLCLDTGLTHDSAEKVGNIRPRVCPQCTLGLYKQCVLCGLPFAECRQARALAALGARPRDPQGDTT